MADGDLTGNIGSYEFDPTYCKYSSIIHIHGDVYAIAYNGDSDDGYIKTVNISKDGITMSPISSYRFSIGGCLFPDIIHISGTVYSVAYNSALDNGHVATFNIYNDGSISGIHSYNFSTNARYTRIIHVSGNVYAIAYDGASNDGYITTVSISSDGTNISNISSYSVSNNGYYPYIIHISGNVYAMSYQRTAAQCGITTVNIDPDGTNISNIQSHNIAGNARTAIMKLYGNVYILVAGGLSGTAREYDINTIRISNDGNTISVLRTQHFYSCPSSCGNGTFSIIYISKNVCAVVYSGDMDDGYIKTFYIPDDGSSITELAGYEYDTWDGKNPDTIHIDGDVYAITEQGGHNDGFIKTLGIGTPSDAIISPPRFTSGLSHRSIH